MLPGEWFTYELDVDLPSIKDDNRVEVEICTNPPDNGEPTKAEPGRTALAIGDSSVIEIGNKLKGVWWETQKELLDVGGNQVRSFSIGYIMLLFFFSRLKGFAMDLIMSTTTRVMGLETESILTMMSSSATFRTISTLVIRTMCPLELRFIILTMRLIT